MNEFKLSDEVISNVAKVLQVAILTGTDIVDNLRLIRLSSNEEGLLSLHPDYNENFEKNISEMLSAAEGYTSPKEEN